MKIFNFFLVFLLFFQINASFSQELISLLPFKKDSVITIRIEAKMKVLSTIEAREIFYSNDKSAPNYFAAVFIVNDILKEKDDTQTKREGLSSYSKLSDSERKKQYYEKKAKLKEQQDLWHAEMPLVNAKVYKDLDDALLEPRLVQILDLSNQHLVEIPDEIVLFENLLNLHLNNNQISEISLFLTKLKNLRLLSLNNNKIFQLPEQINEFEKLENLYLGKNAISDFPDTFFKIPRLVYLDLSDNLINELPSNIQKLTWLSKIGLDGNKLLELPESMDYLNYLTDIYFVEKTWKNRSVLEVNEALKNRVVEEIETKARGF